jgi:hypothetical protein
MALSSDIRNPKVQSFAIAPKEYPAHLSELGYDSLVAAGKLRLEGVDAAKAHIRKARGDRSVKDELS